jgi:hypothetical protein
VSALTAGLITAFVSPVTADRATADTVSVNRAAKSDRQPLLPAARPGRQDSISIERQHLERAPRGCEPAFSPLVESGRGHLLTHCTT